MRTLVQVQEGLWHEQAAVDAGRDQHPRLPHAYANGFLRGLALAINEPEYALALWLDQARHMADESFFRQFHAGKASEVTKQWPMVDDA